jgi:hypothetical protein
VRGDCSRESSSILRSAGFIDTFAPVNQCNHRVNLMIGTQRSIP